MEEATITLYKINKCGYYKKGNEIPEFCNENDMLKDLKDWSNNLELEYTKLHTKDNKDTLPVYLFNIDSSSNGHYLITTWNEVPSTKSGVPSVDKSSKVGKAAVFSNKIQNNSIPGYPTYFFQKKSSMQPYALIKLKMGREDYRIILRVFYPQKQVVLPL